MAEQALGIGPTFTFLTHPLFDGNHHIGEIHLVYRVTAAQGNDGSDLDAWIVHRNEQESDAFLFCARVVCSR